MDQANQQPIAVSDIFKLTVLDLEGLSACRTEWKGRLWSYFDRVPAEKILADYESGRLVVKARDFAAAFQRVKDKIYEMERTHTNENGDYPNERKTTPHRQKPAKE